MSLRSLSLVALLGLVAGLGCRADDPATKELPSVHATGSMNVTVRAMRTGKWNVNTITVNVQPDNISQNLVYDNGAGTFSGTVIVSAGNKTLTASAYATPMTTPVLVGTASTPVTVQASQVVSVYLYILDNTGGDPANDIGPIITSLVVSSTTPDINTPVTMTVNAVDLNGDPVSYAWSDNCTSGYFTAASSATTQWWDGTSEACNVTVTANSTTWFDTATVQMSVFDGSGTQGSISVGGEFIPNPDVYEIYVTDGNGYDCDMWGSWGGSVCTDLPNTAVLPLDVYVYFDMGTAARSGDTYQVISSCGGTLTSVWTNISMYAYTWTPPGGPAACKLSAVVTNFGMTDTYDIGIFIAP